MTASQHPENPLLRARIAKMREDLETIENNLNNLTDSSKIYDILTKVLEAEAAIKTAKMYGRTR